jgi:GNAT superfamily N-acetyltransferase
MEYKDFSEQDIDRVIPLYIHYYNEFESGEWTEETVYKRLHQMMSREDSFGLLLIDKQIAVGFALGYFEQFDDGKTYNLIEIVISKDYQNKGLGTALLMELERQVKDLGAFMISMQSVNDEKHDRFYGELGYGNCTNFVIKVKNL